jgi:MFS family permease
MHISVVEASYQTTVPIVFAGVSPLLWSPIANVYGRRPIFVFVSALGIAAHAASGAASTWGGILTARAFVGIGTSAGMGIGAAVVADMYFMHERGRYMGVFVVFVSNGAHLAAVVGGFAALNIGWRWCYWIPAIVFGINWLVNVFCLPETLYHRNNATGQSLQPHNQPWIRLFALNGVHIKRRLTLWDFTHVFIMLKYPSVLLPALYYSISFGVGSVLFAVTGAAAFGSIYHFDTAQIGMAIGLSTFVGTIVGEGFAGPISDFILNAHTKRHRGDAKPEVRLQAIWPGFIICPAGIIIEGVCLQHKTHWAGPVLGIGIGAFGLQIISTNVYAYVTDCYKPQSAEISTLLNFGRQTFSFTLGFYMVCHTFLSLFDFE